MEIKSILIELVFVIHVIVIIILVILSVYAPILIVVLILVLHRLQLHYYGCIINKVERKLRDDNGYNFFSELSQKITGMPLDIKGVKNMDQVIAVVIIIVAIIMFVFNKTKR